MSVVVFFLKVYYRVDESKEKENGDSVGTNKPLTTDVSARHTEEEDEELTHSEEGDIAVGETRTTNVEDDNIDTSKSEDGDDDPSKSEDLPVKETRART